MRGKRRERKGHERGGQDWEGEGQGAGEGEGEDIGRGKAVARSDASMGFR